MLPVLSHIENFKGLNIWVTTDGICGAGFSIETCDYETEDVLEFRNRMVRVIRQIDPRILVRIEMRSQEAHDLDIRYPRSKDVNEIGFTKKQSFLYLDFIGGINAFNELKRIVSKDKAKNSFEVEILISAKAIFEQFNFKLLNLSQIETKGLFDRELSSWIRSERSIETGTKSIGVVRVLKQPVESFSEETWVKVQDSIAKPYSVSTSFQKIDEARAKVMLERRLKQARSGKDISSLKQGDVTEDLILNNFQSGAQLFEMEVLIVLERNSPAELSAALSQCSSVVSLFSDCMIETFGVAPSYIATKPGSRQHVPLLEVDEALAVFVPISASSKIRDMNHKERSLSLLRSDQGLFHFDLFDPSFDVFNTLIVGTSGKGKSVLTGLLSTALLNDPNIYIIKLDVGGSHSKECELYGGKEFKLSLDRPSGINPFAVISNAQASNNDKLSIVSKFLTSLIQEQGELVFSKSLRAEIENAVREYIDLNPQNPTLHNFFELNPHFPRRDLLKRWVKGGIYEMAFGQRVEDQRDGTELALSSPSPSASRPFAQQRLRYYNFSEIFQAADPEFAQAGVAAVLAQFNIEMLSANGKRLVLICDETPFFIKSCFDFFKFSTANVRKYGHAVVLVSQLSTDFVVNGDTGIVENSPQRFIFSQDGDQRAFKDRFNLTEEDLARISDLRSVSGSYSEVLLQAGNTTRKLTVKVTPEEYWRLTTSKVDKEKLSKLMGAVPGLTMKQAIACLSI